MLGKQKPYTIVEATLNEDFKKRTPFSEFRACNLYLEDGCYKVDFKDKKVGSSAILVNMLNDSALMMAGSEDDFLEKGTLVRVIKLSEK
jgi:molybdopterin molybdotransferase